jgi:hypothetical protein
MLQKEITIVERVASNSLGCTTSYIRLFNWYNYIEVKEGRFQLLEVITSQKISREMDKEIFLKFYQTVSIR